MKFPFGEFPGHPTQKCLRVDWVGGGGGGGAKERQKSGKQVWNGKGVLKNVIDELCDSIHTGEKDAYLSRN